MYLIRRGHNCGTSVASVGQEVAQPDSSNRLVPVFTCILALFLSSCGQSAYSNTLDELVRRLEWLETENRELRREVEALKSENSQEHETGTTVESELPISLGSAVPLFSNDSTKKQSVRMESSVGPVILDANTNINSKHRLLLNQRLLGELESNRVYLHGSVTAVANYQASNREGRFGYLMRHPTESNQVGTEVSEAGIHSVQLGLTGTVSGWTTGHVQMLFNPERSFGGGSNTDLKRNQVQVRRAFLLFGDLNRSPFFFSIGKSSIPFGLTDSVNPFTASTVWHAFGGLANGATVGYEGKKFGATFMAVQGGSQFRAANSPVEATSIPSKLNNFAVDANYRFEIAPEVILLTGISYLRGSAYCQDYPVTHFNPCKRSNPATSVYGRVMSGKFTLKSEFSQTRRAWPGTFNPALPEFAPSKVSSFDVGAKYRQGLRREIVEFSAEFSRFKAGPKGAPWERQEQLVFGVAWHPDPGVKIFGEFIHVNGYAPLNFISGGSIVDDDGDIVPDKTHSDRSARSNVILIGANISF